MPRLLETIEKELTDEKAKESPDKEQVSKLENEVQTRKDFDTDVEKETLDRVGKEKKKLYETIEKHKGDATTNADKLTKAEADLKKLTDADVERKKTADDEADKKKRGEMEIGERMAALEDENRRNGEETNKKLQAQREEFVAEMAQKEKTFDDKLRVKDLETYRQSVIAGAEGQIIPEMVKGSTQEEINASAEQAKTRYTEIREGAVQDKNKAAMEAGKLPGQSGEGKVGPETSPAGGGVDKGGFQEKTTAELSTMTKEELAAHKEKVLQRLEPVT